jgi:putative DNA primase/helicase
VGNDAGEIVRGDRPNSGHPPGYIKNNKTGVEMRWKSKGYVLNDTQKAEMQSEAAEKLRARAEEQERLHEAAAQRVVRRIATLVPAIEPTAYMKAKGIRPQPGVFTDLRAETTYVPATDANGKLWTMQYIREDGTNQHQKVENYASSLLSVPEQLSGSLIRYF